MNYEIYKLKLRNLEYEISTDLMRKSHELSEVVRNQLYDILSQLSSLQLVVQDVADISYSSLSDSATELSNS